MRNAGPARRSRHNVIDRARTCWCGVTRAFADEWWKNYDNPIRAPDWWRRTDAPDDHLTEDEDPEEYFGIVTAGREPKVAYDAVRRMFGGTAASESAEEASAALIGGRVTLAAVAWWTGAGFIALLLGGAIWLRWRPRGHARRDCRTETGHE